jgi:hypothetical protein
LNRCAIDTFTSADDPTGAAVASSLFGSAYSSYALGMVKLKYRSTDVIRQEDVQRYLHLISLMDEASSSLRLKEENKMATIWLCHFDDATRLSLVLTMLSSYSPQIRAFKTTLWHNTRTDFKGTSPALARQQSANLSLNNTLSFSSYVCKQHTTSPPHRILNSLVCLQYHVTARQMSPNLSRAFVHIHQHTSLKSDLSHRASYLSRDIPRTVAADAVADPMTLNGCF